jgi:hypothetical protein
VADGSEAVSLFLALESKTTGIKPFIKGFDFNFEYIDRAAQFTYTKNHFPPEISPHDFLEYFEPVLRNKWKLKNEFWPCFSYQQHDILNDTPKTDVSQYDLVMCNNLIIGWNEEDCRTTIANLANQVKEGGLIVLGGGPLGFVHLEIISRGFTPLFDDIEEIHEAWTVQRRFYENEKPPFWALEPFNTDHPDGIVRYCTVFRKISGK